ncbi:hypothetical protein OOU_Y34scaffold00199g9 [Pyricularia oryzae Y34]|uniref:Uncharacterized protein n=4 Tax=Pyricularia oryzae TaxID=318829 RepID=Q2KFF1_PYRO7|nr:hypothetical protein MGCH7_ch7g735 [Pyricularia oryzae 70-15]ELQ42651.1 hypothetical protein OOU_Y34scaffold00199g9 [Pyricularia oryzae Y34]QBZ65749.1 hypothetical protein PoMZ_12712 [Pyricularia oryzae]
MSHRSIDRPSPEGGTAAGILVQTSDESLTVCEGDGMFECVWYRRT